MRVTVITTVDHNVGDDFVREGIIHLLRKKLGSNIKIELIHKHAPITSRFGFERVRNHRASAVLEKLLPLGIGRDRILECDLLVQSGAPVYWCHAGGPHCSENEWFSPLIRRRYSRVRDRVPLINLAAGSAQRYGDDAAGFAANQCSADADYIREFSDLSAVTTVRDQLARGILNVLGVDAPLIPCTSIFARDSLDVEPAEPEFVALNYMRGAAHYSFGQSIDPDRWEKVFVEFYQWLRERERCVFVCHNEAEAKAARRMDPAAEIFVSRSYREYLKMYARASFGILNRVHGAFALASFGRPSFVIGTDSRARMAEEIGLRHSFVEDVDVETLKNAYAELEDGAAEYTRRFERIKSSAEAAYIASLDTL